MIVVFVLALVAGFAGMVLASRAAVESASGLVANTNIPPFVVGMTLFAIGTDLPEIANSIAASISDHGDVNVGDSVGSAATQITLVLGLLPLIAGTIVVKDRAIAITGALTVAGLGLIAIVTSDDYLGRTDALMLISLWGVGSWIIYRYVRIPHQLRLPANGESRAGLVGRGLAALGVIAVSAMVALWAIVNVAERLDAPEFIVGFFAASIGTSLPELAFDITAIRRGAIALSVGNIFGSSFLDATFSIAAGPLIAPTTVTSSEVQPATIAAMVAVALVTVVMARIENHDWRTGGLLLATYAAFFVILL